MSLTDALALILPPIFASFKPPTLDTQFRGLLCWLPIPPEPSQSFQKLARSDEGLFGGLQIQFPITLML
jgi:hypothetical protein